MIFYAENIGFKSHFYINEGSTKTQSLYLLFSFFSSHPSLTFTRSKGYVSKAASPHFQWLCDKAQAQASCVVWE
jgi:hypothetical protein